MGRLKSRTERRARRKRGIRKGIMGVPARPRLTVYRSAKHIYAQLIDDLGGRTLASRIVEREGWREGRWQRRRSNRDRQAARGAARPPASSRRCSIETDTGITDGFGALADGAREGGLKF